MPARYEYKMVVALSADELSERVNQHLADGWELWGNPFGLQIESQVYEPFLNLHQGMVRIHQEFNGTGIKTWQNESVAGYNVGLPEMPTAEHEFKPVTPAVPSLFQCCPNIRAEFENIWEE